MTEAASFNRAIEPALVGVVVCGRQFEESPALSRWRLLALYARTDRWQLSDFQVGLADRFSQTAAGSPIAVAPARSGPGLSGYSLATMIMSPWRANASLEEVAQEWEGIGDRGIAKIDSWLAKSPRAGQRKPFRALMAKSAFELYNGDAAASYETLSESCSHVESDPRAARGLSRHADLPAGHDRDAARRERQLHRLPRRKLVHRSHLGRGRAHESQPVRGWRSSISANTSSSSPTTWGSAGCWKSLT